MSKRLPLFLGLVVLLVLCFLGISSIKVSADTHYTSVDYGEYNYIIRVDTISGVDIITGQLVSYISGDQITTLTTGETFYSDTYSNSGIIAGDLYLVNATLEAIDSPIYYVGLEISLITNYFDYLNLATNPSNYYDLGYSSGYDIGYRDGYSNTSGAYLEGYDVGYSSGYDVGYSEGMLNVSDTQVSILGVLGTIFFYPFKVIAMGFNVDLFGINIGAIILVLISLGLVIALIRFLLGKGDEK